MGSEVFSDLGVVENDSVPTIVENQGLFGYSGFRGVEETAVAREHWNPVCRSASAEVRKFGWNFWSLPEAIELGEHPDILHVHINMFHVLLKGKPPLK